MYASQDVQRNRSVALTEAAARRAAKSQDVVVAAGEADSLAAGMQIAPVEN